MDSWFTEASFQQNFSIDIYEDYFEDEDESTNCEEPKAKTVKVFKDPQKSSG